MNFNTFPILFMGATLLMGCASDADIHRRQQEFLRVKYSQIQSACDRYGFKSGTVAYSQCLQQQEAQWNSDYNDSVRQTQQQFKKAQCYFSGRLDC